MERVIFLATFLVAWLFPTVWGSPDRRKVQDHLELQRLEKEMVKGVAEIVVPPLKNLLREELLAALCRRTQLQSISVSPNFI